MDNLTYLLLLMSALANLGSCLECYACINQDNNKDKCIKTTKQCEQHQEVCSTTINWGIPEYWTPHGDRIHFISKDCDTRAGCERRKAATATTCKRDWYQDWSCMDCCSGDLCNYYVTLGAGTLRASVILPTLLATATLCLWKWI